jgi:hypothetical protein
MVTRTVVVYDVVFRDARDWRVSVNGVDEHVPFKDRESCIGAATAQARLHHIGTGHTTEVWAPGYGGERECLVRYMTPLDFEDLLRRTEPNSQLIAAGYALGPLFPCLR